MEGLSAPVNRAGAGAAPAPARLRAQTARVRVAGATGLVACSLLASGCAVVNQAMVQTSRAAQRAGAGAGTPSILDTPSTTVPASPSGPRTPTPPAPGMKRVYASCFTIDVPRQWERRQSYGLDVTLGTNSSTRYDAVTGGCSHTYADPTYENARVAGRRLAGKGAVDVADVQLDGERAALAHATSGNRSTLYVTTYSDLAQVSLWFYADAAWNGEELRQAALPLLASLRWR